jgi:hypothetical protein
LAQRRRAGGKTHVRNTVVPAECRLGARTTSISVMARANAGAFGQARRTHY